MKWWKFHQWLKKKWVLKILPSWCIIGLLKTYKYSTNDYKTCSKWCPRLSATIWKRKIACPTDDRKQHELGNVTHMGIFAFYFRSDTDVMDLRCPQSQISQVFKSGDVGSQAVKKCWLIILSSPKWRRSSCFTQQAICGGGPSCIKTVVLSIRLALRFGITDFFNNETHRWLAMVRVTLPVVWNKCITAISVTTESSACNFLQLDLQDPPSCIIADVGCIDASKPCTTVIPSQFYPTLKKA